LKNRSLAERLFQIFIARTDIFGVEDKTGAWRTERGNLTIETVEKHLKGEFTLGVYPFNQKGYIKWVLADLDFKGGQAVYEYICKKFSQESTLMVDTGGKGTHIYAILQPTPLWQIANQIDQIEKELRIRLFPKQREWKNDIIGNFVRLPLGKHHKTGNWSKIVKGDIWTVKPYVTCAHRVYDQYGDGNCLAIDGTVGYCQENLCPHLLKRSQRYGH